MDDLGVYRMAIMALAVWLVVVMAIQVPILARAADNSTDWQVVAFRGALLFMAAVVAARYVFDVSPWLIAVGWLVLDVAATANTIYIRRRARNAARRDRRRR